MLNSLVNNLSIWQSEHGSKSILNDPVVYKTVQRVLISELEAKKNLRRGYVSTFNTSAQFSL